MAATPEIDVDRDTLDRVASSALVCPSSVVDWHFSRVVYSAMNPVSAALYRVEGTARAGGELRRWSSILKICRPQSEQSLARLSSEDRARITDSDRWDREVEAYASGVLASLPTGVSAPRCHAIERTDGGARLWLEEVRDDRETWDIARYGLAGRHLGRLNGTYLAGRPLPQHEWLSRDWIRKWTAYFARSADVILADDSLWSTPIVVAQFDTGARDDLATMRRSFAAWLAALDELPRTIAHLDAFRANMLSRATAEGAETVLIDWAFVGQGPIAADPAQLVVASLFYQGERLEVHPLETAVLAGYAAGLDDVGYRIAPAPLRRAYVLNALARLTFVLGPLSVAGDPRRQAVLAGRIGRPYPEIVGLLAGRTRYLTALFRELD